ncbi:hypothetical protein SAMN03159353_10602 [Cedecea sp. NFIX57]|nr:hypothetical protein SAMN03159353_10602 [Cedecea sp. NFIX57]
MISLPAGTCIWLVAGIPGTCCEGLREAGIILYQFQNGKRAAVHLMDAEAEQAGTVGRTGLPSRNTRSLSFPPPVCCRLAGCCCACFSVYHQGPPRIIF